MQDFLASFQATIDEAHALLVALPEEASGVRPAGGGWSPREVLGHLVDSAANNHTRFVRAQSQDELVFPGYDQNAWVAAQRYADAPWANLVELWTSYNRHILHVVAAMPERELTRERTVHNLHQIAWRPVDEGAATSLEYFVRDYLDHLRHHLAQIRRA